MRISEQTIGVGYRITGFGDIVDLKGMPFTGSISREHAEIAMQRRRALKKTIAAQIEAEIEAEKAVGQVFI